MMKAFAIALTCVAVGAPAFAQDAAELTEQEILERFEKQKTRGLSIAPTGEEATEAAETGAAIQQDIPQEEQVNIAVEFDFDSASLRPDQRPKLDNLCGAMQNADVEVFRVVGHTDAAGSEEYNERLSRLRAEEVVRYLVSDCGIAENRLEAVGMGERNLYDATNPRADENRRVEFQALS